MLNTIQCDASMFGLTGLQYSFYTASELSFSILPINSRPDLMQTDLQMPTTSWNQDFYLSWNQEAHIVESGLK